MGLLDASLEPAATPPARPPVTGLLGGPGQDHSAWNEALMRAAAMLLTPVGRGGGLGAAFAQIPVAQQQAQERALQQRMFGLKEREFGLQGEKLGFEMDQARQKATLSESTRAAQQGFFARHAGHPVTQRMVAEGMLLGIKPDDLKAMAESPNWGRTKLEFQNGIGVDPYDGTPKAIVPNVNAPHMPTLGADGQVGVQPNLPVQNFQMQRARAGATTVAPTFVQEKAESQAVGKFYGEAFGDIQKAGFAAQNRINNINRMAQLLEGIETGRLTPTMKDIAGVAHSLGINIDPALPQKEAIESLSNEMALQARNPSGGAGMPGALSDKDREYLSNIVPGLSKTPGGNRTILETARKLAQRDADVARMAREYRKRNGALNEGFYDELQAFAESNPLFGGEGGAPSLQDAARQELQRRQGR